MDEMRIDTSKACVIGWDGDKDGIICYLEGSYFVRDKRYITVDFGIAQDVQKMNWYNAEGYLPCLVTEFGKQGCHIKIKNFADKICIDGNDYVAVYSRVEISNTTGEDKEISPDMRGEALALQEDTFWVRAHTTSCFDYVLIGDRFGNDYALPEAEKLLAAGGFDEHYRSMKTYWTDKLSRIVRIRDLPDSRLIEAYKAGYIYTHIVKDGKNLHVGENGYDEVFDHDAIGILVTLLSLGDTEDAQEYLSHLQAQIQYDDAKWKFSWPFAVYLLKTGDMDFIREKFTLIKSYAKKMEEDMSGPEGIVKKTWDIDHIGYWTVDNWSVLMGLTAYQYIAEELEEKQEAQWAGKLYRKLLKSANKVLGDTINTYKLSYIPASMMEPNDCNICKNPKNTNWASMFLFGRWAWDGYLFCAKQQGCMLDMIDDTYDYGLARGRKAGLYPHSFGGGTFSDSIGSYNSGFAAAGLRGERYRSEGIYAYQAMIQYGMTGPYAWWESAGEPKNEKWEGLHPISGDGSCPHMWGQAVASKVLIESLIAERSDQSVLIGRGIPEEWLIEGKRIELENYPIAKGRRMGYIMEARREAVSFCFTGDVPENHIYIQIKGLEGKILSVSAGEFDDSSGEIKVPRGVSRIDIRLREKIVAGNMAFRKGITARIIPSKEGTFANCTNGSLEYYTQSFLPENWDFFVDLGRPVQINRINLHTHEKNYAEKFEIQVSVDKENWESVAWEGRNDGLGKSYIFPTVRCRFVKLKVLETVTAAGIAHAVRLIEIYKD